MNIKRLNVPTWFSFQQRHPDWNPNAKKVLEETKPVYNREGWYSFNQKESWIEYNGKAYLYPDSNFLVELKLLTVRLLRPKEMQILKVLQKEHLLSKEQKELLYWNELINHLHYDFRLSDARAMLRFRAFKAKVDARKAQEKAHTGEKGIDSYSVV